MNPFECFQYERLACNNRKLCELSSSAALFNKCRISLTESSQLCVSEYSRTLMNEKRFFIPSSILAEKFKIINFPTLVVFKPTNQSVHRSLAAFISISTTIHSTKITKKNIFINVSLSTYETLLQEFYKFKFLISCSCQASNITLVN